MSKMRIECLVCGSTYDLTSRRIERIEKGYIACYVCNNNLFEYDGCISYYPILVHKKEDHLIPNFPFGNLSTEQTSENAE